MKWHGAPKVLADVRQFPDLADALTTEVLDALMRD